MWFTAESSVLRRVPARSHNNILDKYFLRNMSLNLNPAWALSTGDSHINKSLQCGGDSAKTVYECDVEEYRRGGN